MFCTSSHQKNPQKSETWCQKCTNKDPKPAPQKRNSAERWVGGEKRLECKGHFLSRKTREPHCTCPTEEPAGLLQKYSPARREAHLQRLLPVCLLAGLEMIDRSRRRDGHVQSCAPSGPTEASFVPGPVQLAPSGSSQTAVWFWFHVLITLVLFQDESSDWLVQFSAQPISWFEPFF